MNFFKAIGIGFLALLGVATKPGDTDAAGLRVTGDAGATGPRKFPLDTIPPSAVAYVPASHITTPLKTDGVLPESSINEFKAEHGRELAVQDGTWFCLYNGYNQYTHDTIVAMKSIQFKITNVVGKEVDTVNPCLKLVFETNDGNLVQVAIGRALASDIEDTSANLVCDLKKFTTIEAVYNTQRTVVTVNVYNVENVKAASTSVSVPSGTFNGNVSPYSPRFSVPGIFEILRDGVVATQTPVTVPPPTSASANTTTGEEIFRSGANIPSHENVSTQTGNAGTIAGASIATTAGLAAVGYGLKKKSESDAAKLNVEQSTVAKSHDKSSDTGEKSTKSNPAPVVLSPGAAQFAKAPTRPATSVSEKVNAIQGEKKPVESIPKAFSSKNKQFKPTGTLVSSRTSKPTAINTEISAETTNKVSELRKKFEKPGKE